MPIRTTGVISGKLEVLTLDNPTWIAVRFLSSGAYLINGDEWVVSHYRFTKP